jgi:hypothetical protein
MKTRITFALMALVCLISIGLIGHSTLTMGDLDEPAIAAFTTLTGFALLAAFFACLYCLAFPD